MSFERVIVMFFFRFVTFASEENAKTALAVIKDCKYNDKAIKARLKTESSVKSYFRYLNTSSFGK